MLAELLRVNTADGVRLDGALALPGAAAAPVLAGINAVLFVHGTGGNFYGSTLLETAAQRFLDLACPVLLVNTRGHDLVSTAATSSGPRRQGAAYETLDDCRFDLAAWLDFLQSRGFKSVALLGHSAGALKALYLQAHAPHPAVKRLIALSPPRLSYSHYLAGARESDFRQTLALAESHVAQGRPQALLEVDFPLPYLATAAGYLEKYGPSERYNLLRWIERLSCPTLVTYGSQEVHGNVAFAGMPEEIERLAPQSPGVEVAVIAGADHFYAGARSELLSRLERWLRKQAGG